MPSSTIAIFHLLDDLFRKFDISQSTFFNFLGKVTRLSLSPPVKPLQMGLYASLIARSSQSLPAFLAWEGGTKAPGKSKSPIKKRLLPLLASELPGPGIFTEDDNDAFDGCGIP
jgi:hypothetical protein